MQYQHRTFAVSYFPIANVTIVDSDIKIFNHLISLSRNKTYRLTLRFCGAATFSTAVGMSQKTGKPQHFNFIRGSPRPTASAC
jgi:hypothetical protein